MNVLGIVVFSATMGESAAFYPACLAGGGAVKVQVCCCRSAAGPHGRARRPPGQRVSVHQRVRDEDHQRRRLVRFWAREAGCCWGSAHCSSHTWSQRGGAWTQALLGIGGEDWGRSSPSAQEARGAVRDLDRVSCPGGGLPEEPGCRGAGFPPPTEDSSPDASPI